MKITVIYFACLWLCFSAAAQEKVYFPLFELLNVHPDYQYSTSKLLKTYVDSNGRYEMVLPSKTDSLSGMETLDEIQNKARLLNANYFLIGEMNALKDIMIITISLYKTADGQKVWTDILKARTVDDLDPILQLIAKSLGTTMKASEAEDIYSVSQYNSPALNKRNANTSFGVFIGGTYTFYPHVQNNFSSGLGLKLSYDTRNLIFDINGELYFSVIDIYNLNLNVLYPFSKGAQTPFLGGGLGFGGHSIDTNSSEFMTSSNGGLLLYAHGGYLFNRTSTVQVRGGITAYTATYQIDDHVPYGVGCNLTFTF